MIEVKKGCWVNFDLVLEVNIFDNCLTIRYVNEEPNEAWYFDEEELIQTLDWWEGFLNESH